MGVVYLARRERDFDQRVAIKLIQSGLDSDDTVERFHTERQIQADLDHPNIARLIDGGTTDDGLPFLVMEYVDGVPIHQFCDSHALSVDQRLRLFLQVCGAVSFAHRRQIVHRDLKPANILVTEAAVPKLLDFGIALPLDRSRGPETHNRPEPMTPAYASPEQLSGLTVTPASDIYSLGVLLHEILTGHRLFRHETATATTCCELPGTSRRPPSIARRGWRGSSGSSMRSAKTRFLTSSRSETHGARCALPRMSHPSGLTGS